ncbi:XRE family transcriptional regulator [bacterium]|nr:MAG: XRE family transcriptional regulator [bacterium]
MTIEEAFGKTLRELRKARNLSQEEVAFESGLDRSFISLLECGHQQPSLVTIIQLAKTFRVSAAQLIADVEKNLS